MIKLLNIRLKNFKKFYSGMNKKEVYINFENSEYKTFLVEGPNGAGKTSLLEELNPLPGIHNTYNIISGEIGEKTVTFTGNNGETYQVRYTYLPNKDTHLCKGDLFVLVHGVKKSIVQNSSISETVMKIKQITGYDNKLHKIAAIGIGADERGIVYMGTAERRAYLQAIGPLGDTRLVIKNVNEKYIYTKKSKESIENRLSKLETADTLLISKRNLTNEKNELESSLNDNAFRGVKGPAELRELKAKLDVKKSDMKDAGSVLTFLRDNDIRTSVNDYNESIQKRIGECSGIVMGLNDKLLNIMNKISRCNVTQHRSLTDVTSELNAHAYNKYKDTSIPFVKDTASLTLLKTIYDNFIKQYTDMLFIVPEGIHIRDIINNPPVDLSKINRDMESCSTEIDSLLEFKDANYVPDGWKVTRSASCTDDDCPLYKKFMTIYDKVDKYESAIEKLRKTRDRFESLSSTLREAEAVAYVTDALENLCRLVESTDILCVLDSEVFKDSDSVKHAILNNHIFQYDDLLKQISYVSSLYISYNAIRIEYDELKNNSVDSLTEEKNSIELEIDKVNNEIQDLKVQLSKTVRNNKYSGFDIMDARKAYDDLKDSLYDDELIYKSEFDKRNRYELYKKNNENSLNRLNELENAITEISNKLYLRDALETELETNVVDFSDISKIRETLTKHLPIKVMNKIMLNLKDVTNEFLETTDLEYRIHSFEVTSKDFIIRIQNGANISSDIRNMSQGEMSIMTLATTLALNKIFMPHYGVMTLDEIDATLSEENRLKFLNIIEAYRSFKDLQLFIVSHNKYYSSASDIGVISLRGVGTELKIEPLVSSVL